MNNLFISFHLLYWIILHYVVIQKNITFVYFMIMWLNLLYILLKRIFFHSKRSILFYFLDWLFKSLSSFVMTFKISFPLFISSFTNSYTQFSISFIHLFSISFCSNLLKSMSIYSTLFRTILFHTNSFYTILLFSDLFYSTLNHCLIYSFFFI